MNLNLNEIKFSYYTFFNNERIVHLICYFSNNSSPCLVRPFCSPIAVAIDYTISEIKVFA